MYIVAIDAAVVELVDTLVLGTSASRREGSSPFRGTNNSNVQSRPFIRTKIACQSLWVGLLF